MEDKTVDSALDKLVALLEAGNTDELVRIKNDTSQSNEMRLAADTLLQLGFDPRKLI